MISIEAYRISIGNFNGTRQYDLRSIYRHLIVGTSIRSRGMSRVLKPLPFLAIILFSSIVLLQSGDIETNPGPVNIFKVVKASTHQGNAAIFGRTAGSQCTFMSLSAIVYSNVKSLSYWGQNDLDSILDIGNDLYASFGYVDNFLDLRELPLRIQIENIAIDFERTIPIVSSLSVESQNFIDIPAGFNSGILLVGSTSRAFVFYKSSYYLFDSHSRNEDGMFGGNTGAAILLVFKTKFDLENYLKAYHIDQFYKEFEGLEIQYVKINITEQSLQSLKSHFRKLTATVKKRNDSGNHSSEKRTKENELGRKRIANFRTCLTPEKKILLDEENRTRMANARLNLTPEKKVLVNEKNRARMVNSRLNLTPEKKVVINEKHRARMVNSRLNLTPEEKALNQAKQRTRRAANQSKSKSSASRIEKFRAEVRQGPFYICVVCNRLLYKVSVTFFDENKYRGVDEEVFLHRVRSFDGKEYICNTCNKKLVKNNIPCQAVANDLQIIDLPERFSDIRKLERVIIAKRLLFKRITIMSKGQAPKMKGAICNVPIKADDICNVLPRGMDNNGVVRVALKKKMSFKSNVYFEPVRPQFIRDILIYLKNNNPLYSDIEINVDSIPRFWINAINNEDEGNNLTECNGDEENIEQVKNNENDEEDENPLDSYRIPASETVFVPELAHQLVDDSNITIAPGENKEPLPIICDENCEMLAHPNLFPTGKFGYTHKRDVKLTPCRYFNQRLLNYTQKFSADSDYIFYAQSLMQHLNLNNSINTALKKIQTEGLTAGRLSQNFKETISNLIANDDAFSFMSNLKGSPAYWKKFLYETLAMVKQLGLPTWFMTLSCADLRWPDIIEIIQKIKGKEMTEEEIRNLSYKERTEILQSNPVILARHFQYRVECFIKTILAKGTLGGKLKHYSLRIEFQARGSPHLHCFLWIEGAPTLTLQTVDEFGDFVDRVVSCDLPEDKESELYKMVITYQVHRHSKSCRKYKNQPCRYNFGRFFTERTIIAKPLDDSLENRDEILKNRKRILSPVKEYIDSHFDPRYNNVLDPQKDNYTEPKTIDEILNELNISKDVYYENLAISSDKGFQIHYKRSPAACFINNYFEEGLLAWQANIDIQPVLDYHKAVSYMCAYISKSEDQSTEAMKQAANEAMNSNQSLREKMKSVSRAYRTHREMSIQEAVSIVLPEIWLRKTSPGVVFANSNLPEKRYRVCKSEEEISSMDADDTNVFKKNMLDRYIDRPNRTFKNGRYAAIDDLCYAQFLSNYYLDTKKTGEENDYQPEVLEELDPSEVANLTLPKSVPLMSSKERLKLRKTKSVLRYHVPSKEKKPEHYAHHLLFMFYPFRNEEELKATPSGTYTEKLSSPEIVEVVNRNRAILEPLADAVDEAMYNFHTNARGFDIYGEQENDEVREEEKNYASEEETDNEENTENVYSGGAPAQTIEPLISDDELNTRIRSLNEKQRELFDYIVRWSKKSSQNLRTNCAEKPAPFYIFLTGSAGCGKSYTLNTIRFYLQKALSYGAKNASKERLITMAPTGVAAVNVAGSTINSIFSMPPGCEYSKHINKLPDSVRTTLQERFSELQVIVIDEISMVSKYRLLHIHQRLCDILGCTEDIPFAGISIITCGDFYQLPPIKGGPIFSLFPDALLNVDHCWRHFKIVELTEVMRQRGDQVFIDILNHIRVGIIDENDMAILKQRIINEDHPDYPKDAIHLWAENKPVDDHNRMKLNELPGEEIEVDAKNKYPDNTKPSKMREVETRGQMKTGGLAQKLIFKLGAKVMITSNIDVEDKLCNGQMGTVEYVKLDNERKVTRIYLKMDEDDIGIRAKNSDSYGRMNNLVPIETIEKEFGLEPDKHRPSVKRIQFPLKLAWACTVHKVQGQTFSKIVFSFDMDRQRCFKLGQVYVALSRVTTLQGLYLTGSFKSKEIRCDSRATEEYNYMRENLSLETKFDQGIIDNEFKISLLNVRSLKKHAIDIKNDASLFEGNLIFMTETQLAYDTNTAEIENTLSPLLLHTNNSDEHIYSNTAAAYKKPFELIDAYRIPGATLYKFRHSLIEFPLSVILLYRQQNLDNHNFLYKIQHLQDASEITHIILGDFNKNYVSDESDFIKAYLEQDYQMIVQEPTHISGSLIDHVYIHKDLFKRYEITALVQSIYYSDHDAIQMKFKKRLCENSDNQ